MASHMRIARRAIVAALGCCAVLMTAVPASADPPNCTSADLAGIMSGVTAATSVYLFTHPEVNNFFTGLKGLPMEDKRQAAQDYLASNPQVKADLQGIRQPSVDFRNRCGA